VPPLYLASQYVTNYTNLLTHYTPTYSLTLNGGTLISAETERVWRDAWNVTTTATTTWQQWVNVNVAPVMTPEQAAALEREVAHRAERRRAADAQRVAVHARALEMFLGLLSEAQRAEHDRFRYIHVRGSRGRLYRIDCRGQAGNVYWVDRVGGPDLASMCCHPGISVPNPDAWAAQKLALETDEDAFVTTANVSGPSPLATPPPQLIRFCQPDETVSAA
jgi:hypothetical protein